MVTRDRPGTTTALPERQTCRTASPLDRAGRYGSPMSNISGIPGDDAEAPRSAAGPLAGGFATATISLLLVIGGGVLATQNDDWFLVVAPGVVALVVGLLKISEGIFLLVRAHERALARR